MAKVRLIEGSANVTPWGQRCEGGVTFQVTDESELDFFRSNPRYKVGESVLPPSRGSRTKPKVEAPHAAKPAAVAKPAKPKMEATKNDVSKKKAKLADVSVLDLSISALARALAKGTHDESLDQLRAAEEAGKTRKGAINAINERADILAKP
jgi:hypothetical protein